jgi:hypothetical protein
MVNEVANASTLEYAFKKDYPMIIRINKIAVKDTSSLYCEKDVEELINRLGVCEE